MSETKTKTSERSETPKSATRHNPARTSAPTTIPGVFGLTDVRQTAGNLALQGLFRAGAIKAKLTISQPNDPDEQEADRVADRIMRMEDPGALSSLTGVIHRKCGACEAGDAPCPSCAEEEKIQRKESTGATSQTSTSQHSQIAGLRGGGEPLSPSVRAFFEPRLGINLGHVRVHTDSKAADSARNIRARAYTIGTDLVFASHEYAPERATGQRLLAHELTHVAQQSSPANGAVIRRDATDQSISLAYAAGLEDGDLMYEIQLVESLLANMNQSEDSEFSLSSNLNILRAEYFKRDPGANAGPSLALPVSTAAPSGSPGPSSDHGASLSSDLSLIPEGGTAVNRVGIVAWDGESQLRLRSSPDTSTADNIITSLPFGMRLQVIKSFPGDWYFVSTASGELGYAASTYIFTDLPEPNARLHRVQPGISGTAIGIAEHYYSDYADDWGQDLRFYVNVLGWANHMDVPDSTTGWRAVHFQAGQLIWVPSQQFAYSLKGVVNSGSLSYNIADYIGIADFLDRIEQLWNDFRLAVELSGQYMAEAIAHRLEEALWGMVEGLVTLLLGAVAILAISTAVGAAIGALAGGVGAAPGAAAGFEVGMVIIEWIGLGMLVYWIGQSLVQLASAFGAFLGTVWDAHGNREILAQAGREFADAIALLIAKIFEALLLFMMARGLPKGLEAIRGTRLGKALGETRAAKWLSQRHAAIESGEAPLPGPGEVIGRIRGTGRPGAEPANVVRAGNHQAFNNLPPDRLPANLPEGHFWMRTPEGEWVLMRESGAPPTDFELTVYADAAGNTNYVLRTGDRMIQSDAITRTGSTYSRNQRLPEELEGVGANNPFRDPLTGEVFDKGHGVDFADTLEGPGVHSSATDPANFTPQVSWWNQGPRNSLVGRIRNGHAASGRPGGGGYREMAIYVENPPVTADGTLIPREFVFVETTSTGAPVRAWRIPNRAGAGTRSLGSIDPLQIPLSEVPPIMLRSAVSIAPSSGGLSYAPFIVFGVLGDDEQSETGSAGECTVESNVLPSVDAPAHPQLCE